MSTNIRIFEYSNILGLEYIFVFGFITFQTFEYIRIFARSSEYIRIFCFLFFVCFKWATKATGQQKQVHDRTQLINKYILLNCVTNPGLENEEREKSFTFTQMRRLESRQERQKLVKCPPPLQDALTFPAETIVHVQGVVFLLA